MATGKWSKAEVVALRKNYPKHGAIWDGWDSILPGRTVSAIRHKARTLGVFALECQNARPPMMVTSRDPFERYVISRMRDGIPPTKIDEECKWVPGRTVMILTDIWGRDRDTVHE